MAARPVPEDLLPWALLSLGEVLGASSRPDTAQEIPLAGALSASRESVRGASLAVVAGDASHRRYFRLTCARGSYIVVEAPPATEKNREFVAVRDILAAAGLSVPRVFAADFQRGYMLLQDLGDATLLPRLNPATVQGYYEKAFDELLKLAELPTAGLDLPRYDEALLIEELELFSCWFVEGLLGYSPTGDEMSLVGSLNDHLVHSALQQPSVLVHRDFHSRNIMVLPEGSLGVIDFQDAVVGPVTYDLVSLLRDCYIRWPADQVDAWVAGYLARLQSAGRLQGVGREEFARWFDLMGLQRHLKVLGIFARLHLRDGKAAYLDDLPLVLTYVKETVAKYAETEPLFARFRSWFDEQLAPLVAQQPWSRAR